MRTPQLVIRPALVLWMSLISLSSYGQERHQQSPKPPSNASAIGYQGFFGAGLNLPAASDSFSASSLDDRPIEIGAGFQATNVWRNIFVQIALSGWNQTGERTFIDSSGTSHPLGIPLSVKTTFMDFGGGWRFENARGGGRSVRAVPYGGGGIGFARYRESSPFATDSDDLDNRFTSYHVFGGVEVGLTRWIGIAADVRYRFVPGVLGGGGVSSVLGDHSFDGASVGLRFVAGSRGRTGHRVEAPRKPRAPEPRATETNVPPPQNTPATPPIRPVPPKLERTPPSEPSEPMVTEKTPATASSDGLVAIAKGQLPVYVRPEVLQTPLVVLPAGIRVTVLDDFGEWLRIEFNDRQWGRRVGYVQRRLVTISQP
jgi:opacity protein-like surface antigen